MKKSPNRIFVESPFLWNHHPKEYRDRNLREEKSRELMEQSEGQFTVAKIKQHC